MTSRTSPLLPDKPDHITRDPIASAEWDRICEQLRTKRHIIEVGHNPITGLDPITEAARGYSAIVRIDELLEAQGRNADNEPMAADQAKAVRRYLRCMAELEVEPGPLVRLRPVD